MVKSARTGLWWWLRGILVINRTPLDTIQLRSVVIRKAFVVHPLPLAFTSRRRSRMHVVVIPIVQIVWVQTRGHPRQSWPMYGRWRPKVLERLGPTPARVCWREVRWQHGVIVSRPVPPPRTAARHAVVLECLHLFLQADEAVEPGDLHRHVERRGVVQHARELERPRQLVVLAGGLDELDELLVECEFARYNLIRSVLVTEGVAGYLEVHGFTSEAEGVISKYLSR